MLKIEDFFITEGTLEGYIPVGGVSHATLRTPDLIQAFVTAADNITDSGRYPDQRDALQNLIIGWFGSWDGYNTADIEKWCEENPDDASVFLNEELFPFMDELALDGYYFGNTEGDGSDFGFWPTLANCTDCYSNDVAETMTKMVQEGGFPEKGFPLDEKLLKELQTPCPNCGWTPEQAQYVLSTTVPMQAFEETQRITMEENYNIFTRAIRLRKLVSVSEAIGFMEEIDYVFFSSSQSALEEIADRLFSEAKAGMKVTGIYYHNALIKGFARAKMIGDMFGGIAISL